MTKGRSLRLQEKVGMLANLVRSARLVWRLLGDERVSLWLKAIPLLALAYLLFPFDFLPDIFPALGQVDDLAVLFLALKLFLQLVPPEVVESLRREMESHPAHFRVVDEEEDRNSFGYIEAAGRSRKGREG